MSRKDSLLVHTGNNEGHQQPVDIGTIVSYLYLPITLPPGVSMRQGFTLIELMIVIAIIAIIAAIAVPNLLESRIAANETAAAASLKSGILPAQVQFISRPRIDINGNSQSAYAMNITFLAGRTANAAPAGLSDPPFTSSVCTGLDAGWNNQSAPAAAGVVNQPTGGTTNLTSHGPYNYGIVSDVANEANAETYWGAYAVPSTSEVLSYDGANGRRSFGISNSGAILQTNGNVAFANLNFAAVSAFGNANAIFLTNPAETSPAKGAAGIAYLK